MVKKILSILLWVVTAAALVVLFIFARENYLSTPVKAVNLLPETGSGFVETSVLSQEIEAYCTKSEIGTVDMIKIQRHLSANPWIESSSTYIDLDGNLNVRYKEYNPLFRVFGNKGHSVYVTDKGVVIPSCAHYTPYVLVASGNFDVKTDSASYILCDTLDSDHNLLSALHWIKAIEANTFIANCVGQLYCNNKNQFELTVKGLDARIIVSDTCLASDKLNRLEIFMKQRISKPETQTLKIINLNYKNQIVCTKR